MQLEVFLGARLADFFLQSLKGELPFNEVSVMQYDGWEKTVSFTKWNIIQIIKRAKTSEHSREQFVLNKSRTLSVAKLSPPYQQY